MIYFTALDARNRARNLPSSSEREPGLGYGAAEPNIQCFCVNLPIVIPLDVNRSPTVVSSSVMADMLRRS
jgi:hypothetical protein